MFLPYIFKHFNIMSYINKELAYYVAEIWKPGQSKETGKHCLPLAYQTLQFRGIFFKLAKLDNYT